MMYGGRTRRDSSQAQSFEDKHKRRGRSLHTGAPQPSVDGVLLERGLRQDALEAESRQIDRLVLAREDELGDGPAHARSVLEAVAREARREDEAVPGIGVEADDAVVVERVELVEPRPRRLDLEALERGDALGQRGPDFVVKQAVIDAEPLVRTARRRVDVGIRICRSIGRDAAQEPRAVAAEVGARDVDRQRRVVRWCGISLVGVHHEDASLSRRDWDRRHQSSRVRPGREHRATERDAVRRFAAVVVVVTGDDARSLLRAGVDRVAAAADVMDTSSFGGVHRRLQHRPRVEVAFVAFAEGAHTVSTVEPREPRGEGVGVEPRDPFGARVDLHRMC
mmetsp:Transcript_15149/g.60856  ORF Transcript_15149/g.60856 Transcript_15149/m.60856 type:complete len:337 (+) Transcript_15149:1466-2476(+)